MNIQLEWLKQYVDFDQSAEEIAHLLTMSGLEMEGMEEVELPDGTKTPVLELNVTPNRGYCLSHIGVARELAALLDQSLRLPNPPEESNKKSEQATVSERIKVENEDASLCPRYAAMMIENVTPGPSPKWLSDRLHAVGLRPINNIVDITNFVLMEFGQPLHAFDFDKLAGRRIVVRRAKKGERFTSLTGVELKLDTDALVIADAEKPVALAGIMGGANSEVTESTKTVVLESAFFDPVVVRKGSKKYGLRTDSSYRFERRVDIEAVITAQTRAAHLIQEIAGGKIVPDRIDIYPKPFARSKVRLRISRVNQILGTALEAEKILGYLRKMGLHIQEQKSAEEYQVEIPTCYPNLTREADLIEEVARLNGFENI
ncbi:MAG: phenylalanine--tRNA ligase subunit beta, partial [Nitrospinales bacterium]